MQIVVKNIPKSVLFYYSDSKNLYEIHFNFDNGRITEPILCRRQDTSDSLKKVERYYKKLLNHISNVAVQRLLIESMIIDATIEVAIYENEIRSSAPEQLAEQWEETDEWRWWSILYPTRLAFLEGNMRTVQMELENYERMLEGLKKVES